MSKKENQSKSDETSEGCGKWEANTTPKFISAIRDDDWRYLLNSILYLFHKKKLQRLELDMLQEKVRNVRDSKIGAFIAEYYQDSILKKGMIVIRENIKDKNGQDLLNSLAESWKQFYTNILPTILAIFYPIQEQGIYLRSDTLIGFRDMVLLKTKIYDALTQRRQDVANEIKQMLLVLSSVHDSNPPNRNYMRLEYLLTRVVRPYLGYNGLYLENKSPECKRRSSDVKSTNDSQDKEKAMSRPCVTKNTRSSLVRSLSEGVANSEGTILQHEIPDERILAISSSLSATCEIVN